MRIMIELVSKTPVDDSITLTLTEIKRKAFIEVRPNQSIWMLKTLIFGEFSIPPCKQQLFIKVRDESAPKATANSYSQALRSYKLIKDYPIEELSEVQLEILEKENINEFPNLANRSQTHSGNMSSSMIINPSSNSNSHNSKKINPDICFAIGKGLYRGICGMKYKIKLYRVGSNGSLIHSTSNLPFQIEITKLKSTVDTKKMTYVYDQRKSDYSLLTLSPLTSGEYSISIKIDDTHICGSPFPCTIIDELNPKLKELAFSNEWIEETVELITMISKKDSTLDHLFSFGIENLINLMFYPDPTIQVHITGVLARLLELDKNKERVLREYGIEFFFKIVSLDNWTSFMELRRFISSSLSILISNRAFLSRFYEECSIGLISMLSQSEHPDCIRSCSIVLCQLSENLNHDRFSVEDIKEILITMLQSKDNITKKCAVRAVSNLSSSFDTKKESSIKLITCLLDLLKSTTLDVSLKVLIYKSFSNFCRNEQICIYLLSNGFLDLIAPTDPCQPVEVPMFYQWESNIHSFFQTEQSIDYSLSCSQIFSEESDHTFYLSLTISNMLYTSSSLKIHERFSQGNGLSLVKQFVLCHNSSTRVESFRSIMLITLSPNDVCKKNLITNGIINFLMSSIYDCSSIEIPFIISSISNLCEYDRTCVESIGSDGIDKLLKLLRHQQQTSSQLSGSGGVTNVCSSNSAAICSILANIASSSDRYNTKIVNGGSKVFLRHLLEFAKSKKISVIKPITYQDINLGVEVGHGVSGTVWKGTWNSHVVAIKYYNEENLGFDEREFYNEGTILTVLSHPNILHCIGGSQQHGKMFLVCDYFSRGSLYNLIHSKDLPLSKYKIVHFAIQTACGMEYLHSLGIIHRDLKSGNLLIDDDWNVRICDFGVSRIVDPRRMTKGVGSACYMAVEVLKGLTEYSQKADVFSFGVILWECFSREIPYHDKQQIEWINLVLEESYRLPIPENCPPEISSLIKRCWDSNSDARPTFTEIQQELIQYRDKMKADGIFEIFEQSLSTNPNSQTPQNSLPNSPVTSQPSSPTSQQLQQAHPQLPSQKLHQPNTTSTVLNNNSSLKEIIDSSEEVKSVSDEEVSSSLSSGTGSPTIGTTSPTPSPSWKKWEMSAPDRQKSKRISAFRSNMNNNASAIGSQSAPPSNATSPKDSTLETEPIPIATVASASTSPNGAENTNKTVTNTFSTISTDTSGIPFSLSSNDEEFSDTSSFMSSAVSAMSSRSNSTLSINDNFHPNFNPSELDGLLQKSNSEHPLRSSSTHYFNTIKPIPNRSKHVGISPLMGTSRTPSLNKIDIPNNHHNHQSNQHQQQQQQQQPSPSQSNQSCISPSSSPLNSKLNNNNSSSQKSSFSPPSTPTPSVYKKIAPIVKLPAATKNNN